MKKIGMIVSMLLVLLGMSSLAAAGKMPVNLHVIWVQDQASGIKAQAVSEKETPGETWHYRWLGASVNGMAEGIGKLEEYRSGKLDTVYEGSFVSGKMQGPIHASSPDGKKSADFSVMDGVFGETMVVITADGTMTLTMQANKIIKVKMENGSGDVFIFELENGHIVSGSIKMRQGSYEGQMNDAGINGQGIRKDANGRTYEGQFVNSRFNGQGKLTEADGSVYSGGFVNGLRQGYGVQHDSGGQVTGKGTWEKDKLVEPQP